MEVDSVIFVTFLKIKKNFEAKCIVYEKSIKFCNILRIKNRLARVITYDY